MVAAIVEVSGGGGRCCDSQWWRWVLGVAHGPVSVRHAGLEQREGEGEW